MTPIAACTIASNNYLALASVFAESYKAHHPGAEVYVCVVDRPSPKIRYADFPFRAIFADELGIPAFENFAFRYGVLELNTAVKPYLLAWLRDEARLDRVFYFDPDILVLNPLGDLADSLEHHSAVLTPHITEPLDNAFRPSERIILMSGVYNLGFLGIRLDQSTSRFLEWWQERLYRFCFHDIHAGLFVDQSWMDLAPALLPALKVERSPAYNVAYWNLPHRVVHREGGIWTANGVPLGFFHFSGFMAENLEDVSKYQNRVRLSERPALVPLFAEYRRRLTSAGHETLNAIPYGFQTFTPDGPAVSPALRRILTRIDPYGLRWPAPFASDGEDSFLAWLLHPLRFAGGTLNHAALGLWEQRTDLVHAFPRVFDEDLPRYVEWLRGSGAEQRSGLDDSFLVNLSPRRSAGTRAATPAIIPEIVEPELQANPLAVMDLRRPGSAARWLNEPVPAASPAPVVTRLALRLYELREDVQQRFPNPLGEDQHEFAHWFAFSAAAEYRLHPALFAPVLAGLPRRVQWKARFLAAKARLAGAGAFPVSLPFGHPLVERERPSALPPRSRQPLRRDERSNGAPDSVARGVNLAGYFDSPTGVGQVARGSRAALQSLGIPIAEVPLDHDVFSRAAHGRVLQPNGSPFGVTLLHVNADETPRALSLMPSAVQAGSYRIGYWFWELSYFPLAFSNRFALLDEVWAPTRFCEASIKPLATIPVRYVPPCVLPSTATPDRERFGLEEGRFYFFFAFDTWSVPERKNPFAVLDAFLRVDTGARANAGLVLKVNQPSKEPTLVRDLRERARGSNVIIHTGSLDRAGIDQLMASTDAYVALHRSEGLGLPPIEAMQLGKPVIATGYGGVTDFLDESTGYPVSYRLTSLDRDHPPYPRGAVWAEPDVDHAAELMTRVLRDREDARRRSEAARKRVEALYGLSAGSARLGAELERVFSRSGAGRLVG